MSVTTTTRNTVFQRDNFACIHCGSMKNMVLRQRSHTGNGSAENLVTMCVVDSDRINTDQHFADLAMNHGWKLRSWEQPENRAVYYQADNEWFYLTDRGTRIRAGETADNGG